MNKIIRKIENSLQTDDGQRFLQYAYSFGAAIVIFGAMVKVLHWWGIWGNIIFGTGMAIECIVFILYGLDRPPKAVPAEKAIPALQAAENGEDIRNIRPAAVTSRNPADQPRQVSDNMMKFEQEYARQMEALNRETEKMTRQIQELNQIYSRLIQAMTTK